MNINFATHAKNTRQAKIITGLAVLFAACFMSANAMAMAVPAAGSFAYDLYDIGVNQILLGPDRFCRRCCLHGFCGNSGHSANDFTCGRRRAWRCISAEGRRGCPDRGSNDHLTINP